MRCASFQLPLPCHLAAACNLFISPVLATLSLPCCQVGMVAINDGIILEACIYRILQKHFGWGPGRIRACRGAWLGAYQCAR